MTRDANGSCGAPERTRPLAVDGGSIWKEALSVPEKNPKKPTEILDSLMSLIFDEEQDIEKLPMSRVDKALKEMNIDPGPLLKSIQYNAAKARTEAFLRKGHAERERVQRLESQRAQRTSRMDVRSRLQELLASRGELTMGFRKAMGPRSLEDMSDEDLVSLLEDSELLDYLEEKGDEDVT